MLPPPTPQHPRPCLWLVSTNICFTLYRTLERQETLTPEELTWSLIWRSCPCQTARSSTLTIVYRLGFSAPNFTINGVSFVSPTVPVLLQILSGQQQAQNLLPAGSVYGLPKNKVIEINLNGGNAVGGPRTFNAHFFCTASLIYWKKDPFHLHGVCSHFSRWFSQSEFCLARFWCHQELR